MKKQTTKQLTFIMIAIGLFCGSLGLMLIHFGKISDGFAGFIMGLGIGIEILAIVVAKKFQQCDSQFI